MEEGKLMSTTRAIQLPDELVSGIEHAAVSQGKSPDQWVEDTLRAQLEWSSWRELLAYGRGKAAESEYSEVDVPALVKEWRREQRG
jgi:predicted transcriptional regulator